MGFRLVAPADPRTAVELLRSPPSPPALPLTGGTDLLLDIDDGRADPATVVSLRRLPWRDMRWDGPALEIGSTAPLARLEDDDRIGRELPGLLAGVQAVGSRALRERATVGGNLGRASPASDLIPVLLALDAEVSTVGPRGGRVVPVAALVLGPRRTALEPGELIRSIRIPEPRPSAYVWQRVRPANDISQVGVAVAWSAHAGRWSVAVGGTSPTPVRLPDAEAELSGARPDAARIAAAAATAARTAPFPSDRRASEEHRRRVLAVLFGRALAAAVGARP